jgi:hypothetical protein
MFAVLRNPVDRAYSNYLYAVRLGREPLTDFKSALDREEDRIRENWSPLFWYKRNGMYFNQLSEYFAVFPRAQIKIFLYDDLRKSASTVMSELYNFIGVEPSYHPDASTRFNRTGTPRSASLYQAALSVRNRLRFLDGRIPAGIRNPLHRAAGSLLLGPPRPMDADVRGELAVQYREQITRLQDLINRDLSAWL